jgi:hypothetical protein
MSKLNWEERSKLAWAALSLDDFVQSRTTPESLPIILDKLQENYSDGQVFMILYNDTPTSVTAVLKTVSSELLPKIAFLFGATASNETLEIKLAGSDLILAAKTIEGKIESL